MTASIIDGRAAAAAVTEKVATEARRLKAEAGVVPGLAVVLVGSDPASEVYVGAKGKKAEELGFKSIQHTLPATTSQVDLLALVAKLNRDPAVHGILVQFPLPDHLDQTAVVEAIAPQPTDRFLEIGAGPGVLTTRLAARARSVSAVELDDLILTLNRVLGLTLVLVTHELPSILKIARRCIMLDKETQSIIATGDPRELREDVSDPRVHQFFNRLPKES